MSTEHSVAVVVCAYTLDRWEDLVGACRSLLAQSSKPDEIVLVIDHNELLLERIRAEFPQITVVANTGRRGLSGARNTGVAATGSDLVLFLDDDARAEDRWVELLREPFHDPAVQGVAGWASPSWDEPGRPRWFPEPFLWVVGCSYLGLPTVVTDVRNPLGAAMGFRRSAWVATGGFNETVGRVGTHPVGCEETEFSIKLRQIDSTARIVMQPAAVVAHRVRVERHTFKYFLSRCYWEGVSKAVVSSSVGSSDALASERNYTTKVLPRSLMQGLGEGVRGEWAGLLRSAALIAGLSATVAGYARGQRAGVGAASVEHDSPQPPANHPDAPAGHWVGETAAELALRSGAA